MRRIATPFRRYLGTLAAAAALVVSTATGASAVDRVELGIESISTTWQVGDFPGVRLYGALGSTLESVIRSESETAGPLSFAEDRLPAWLRPQPQPKVLIGEVSGTPGRLFLEQNYPNPFNPSTVIRYGLPTAMKVKLTVHTLLGTQIRTLVDQWQDAGTWSFDFVAADLPSGAYFYRLQTDLGTITRRMIISK
jgi:hypothetical protein